MKTSLLIMLLSVFTMPMGSTLKFNFGTGQETTDWRVVVDGVMGGLSTGKADYQKKSVIFSGNVSLENNGGFSSFRSPYQARDLSVYKTLTIRYRTQGISFYLVLNTDQRFYLPNYKYKLPSETEKWQEVTINLMDFHQQRMGQPTGRMITSDNLKDIIRMGFINAEKRAGPFELEIDYIRFE